MNLEDAIDQIRPSVVQIQRLPRRPSLVPGERGEVRVKVVPPEEKHLYEVHVGSGFLVRQLDAVITAAHVLENFDFEAGDSIAINFAVPPAVGPTMVVRGAFVGTTAEVIRVSKDDDLALLRAPGVAGFTRFKTSVDGGEPIAPRPKTASLSTSALRDGTAIAVSGYPLAEPALVTTSGALASSFTYTDPDAPTNTGERLLADITANPGNSGGPAYSLRDSRVIGVCVAGRLTRVVGGGGAHAAGLTLLTPAARVEKLLDDAGVPTSEATELQRRTSKGAAPRRGKRKK